MKIFPKVTTVDTNNIHTGELIHMYFAFYNVTSIRGFTLKVETTVKEIFQQLLVFVTIDVLHI